MYETVKMMQEKLKHDRQKELEKSRRNAKNLQFFKLANSTKLFWRNSDD